MLVARGFTLRTLAGIRCVARGRLRRSMFSKGLIKGGRATSGATIRKPDAARTEARPPRWRVVDAEPAAATARRPRPRVGKLQRRPFVPLNCATVGKTRLNTEVRYCSMNWMNILADLLPKSATGSVWA